MKLDAKFQSHALFTVALILVVAANAIVLGMVAANRSGAPESRLTLTERELGLGYRRFRENSGLSLHLSWRSLPEDADQLPNTYWRTPAWLDEKKLEALGIPVSPPYGAAKGGAHYRRPLSKAVFIVLELGGAPYQEALRRAQKRLDAAEPRNLKNADRRWREEQHWNSRLFAVDAGLDPGVLRTAYPDRQRFIIAQGEVKPIYRDARNTTAAAGRIVKLMIENIHVPLKFRPVFETLPRGAYKGVDEIRLPRYEVTLAYGKRLEPWIVSVKPLEDTPVESSAEKN